MNTDGKTFGFVQLVEPTSCGMRGIVAVHQAHPHSVKRPPANGNSNRSKIMKARRARSGHWDAVAVAAGARRRVELKSLLSALMTLLALALPSASRAQAASDQPDSQFARWTAEQREVWRTVEQWNDAFEANDADRYFTFIDPDIIVLTPASPFRVEGIAADRREFLFGLARGSGRVAFFQEVQPHVTVVGDMAYATYYNRGWYGAQGQERLLHLRETDVLRRRGGRWKITHIHVSDVK